MEGRQKGGWVGRNGRKRMGKEGGGKGEGKEEDSEGA
jgi:hypothetical protein